MTTTPARPRGASRGLAASPRHPVTGATEVALLDRSGVIVSVNQAWVDFCLDNGGDPSLSGVGTSYLQACEAAAGDPTAAAIAEAIRTALTGDLPAPRRMSMRCDGDGLHRTFDVLVSSRLADDGSCLGATVALVPTFSEPLADTPRAPRSAGLRGLEERAVLDLLDAIDDGVVVLDARTRQRVYANASVLRRTGRTLAELTSIPPGAPSSPAEGEAIGAAIDALLRGDVSEAVLDSHIAHRDGSTLPVEMRLTYRPATQGDPGPGHVVIVSRSTAARRDSERALRASEETFRAAFEQAPTGMAMVIVDTHGSRRILRANAAMGEILGLPAQDLAGRDLAAFTHPDDDPANAEAALDFASGRMQALHFHKRYIRPDGSLRWADVHSRVVPFPEHDGVVTLAHVVDVTERRRMGAERHRKSALDVLAGRVTTLILAGSSDTDVRQEIVHGVMKVFGAANATLALLPTGPGEATYLASAGRGALPRHGRTSWDAVWELLPASRTAAAAGAHDLAVVRLADTAKGAEVLALTFPQSSPITDTDLDLLTDLAGQIQLAVRMEEARADKGRLALLQERNRIARDLHDTVIQDLIAIGMQLASVGRKDPNSDRRETTARLVDNLDDAIRRLRTSVFDLARPPREALLSGVVEELLVDATRVLGHAPTLTMEGDLDVVPRRVGEELLSVLRECLSNVARHAEAHSTHVGIVCGAGRLTLAVEDDGHGVDPQAHPYGTGLRNMRARAEALGGAVQIVPASPGGTLVMWSVPVQEV